jgi:5-methylcytosine-specific restriction endonuclease McrA
MTDSSKICSIDGCISPIKARGMCSKHYSAWHHKRYYAEHKDQILANQAIWRNKNRDEIRKLDKERCKKYRATHREERNSASRKYYSAHKDALKAKMHEYHQTHKDEASIWWDTYYKGHRHEVLEHAKEYHLENRERDNTRSREYALEHRDVLLAKHRIYWSNNSEWLNAHHKHYLDEHPEGKRASNKHRTAVTKLCEHHHKGRDVRHIFNRANGECTYCGRRVAFADGQIDHVIPLCRGGDDGVGNLTWACKH